jgi:Sulfotransferase family
MADAAPDRGAQGQPLLVFVHIPKTAGTTLTTVLRTNEPGTRTRHGGNVFKGSGGLKQGVRFESLLNNKQGQLDRARALAGHFPLGIREYMPEDREARYFTFLREPADRTLSHYFAIRERRGGVEEPNKLELPPLPAEATVQDALERGYIHDNVHTRMLSGLAEPFGEVDEEMLERAKHNLREELAFFGLTERFDESLVLAKRRLGFRSILYRPFVDTGRSGRRSTGRVNTERPRGDALPSELLEAAQACNRYDIELYRYAERLFDEAPELQELEFEVELAALRAAKAEGEIDLEVPPPDRFDGGQQLWRMLLQATATSLRHEQELAQSESRVEKRSQREQEALDELLRIHARGKTTAGRDAETAMRVIEVLAPAQAKALANGVPEPKAADDDGGRKPRRGGGRRGRRRASPSGSDAH